MLSDIYIYLCGIVSKSRAGEQNQQFVQGEDPNKQMLKELGTGTGAETMSKNLAKDREYERILN